MTSAEPGRPARPRPRLPFRARVALPLLLLLGGLVTARLYGGDAQRDLVALRGEALGTTWSVKLVAPGLEAPAQRRAQDVVEARLARVDALMSTWRDDSELMGFNRHASTAPYALSPETLAVFDVAQQVSALSGGAFDATVAPLVDAWGFGRAGRGPAPDADRIAALRADVGWEQLRLDAGAGTLAKGRPAIACDLSAVAKGYAVDELARALEALGHERFLVEVGGELRGRGGHLDGAPWRVAIEAPVTLDREIHRVVSLRDLSMATSGDYRNYYEQDGRRISHTLDPRTGRPIEHRLASVTVLHPEAVWADAWATALNVLGPDEGYTLAVAQGLAAYFIVRADVPTDEGSYAVRMTAAFEPHLADAPEAATGP